ncbi:MAG: arylesterase [Gammaproteobacteria bacterium]|nr:arylesterase [Gammaproteobacteria bacterium]
MVTTRRALWLLMLCLALCPRAFAEPPGILVVGDSLSAGYGLAAGEGWVNLLADELGSDFRVVNASISGDTTSGGLTRLPRALRVHRPQVVLIELGGNDGLRGTSLAQTRRNLDEMIQLSLGTDAKVVLIGMQIPPNLGPTYTAAFAAIFPQLASLHGVALVPFLLEGIATDPSLMQDDGIHPRAAAQAKMLETVRLTLDPVLETLN